MLKTVKINKLAEIMKEREWMTAYDLMALFELSLEEIYDAFDGGLPVFCPNLQTRIYPTSQLREVYNLEQQVEVLGCLEYDPNSERIYLEQEPKLPDFLVFELNELTGMWRIYLNIMGLNSPKDYQVDTENLLEIPLVKYSSYNNFSRHVERVSIFIKLSLHEKITQNTLYYDYDSNSDRIIQNEINVPTIFISAKSQGKEFYGVPSDMFSRASSFILSKYKFATNSDYFSYVSKYTLEYLYRIPAYINYEYKKIDMFDMFNIHYACNVQLLDYYSVRKNIIAHLPNYYVKTNDFKSYLRRNNREDMLEEQQKWEKLLYESPPDKEKAYIEYAILKFQGAYQPEIFYKVLKKYKISKAREYSSITSATSDFGNEVKDFATKNNLVLPPESRGTKAKLELPKGTTPIIQQ